MLAVLITACGSPLSPGVAGPSANSTPIPWLAATVVPTPMPTPAPVPRPIGIPSCRAADLAGVFIGGQGATGWITRSFAIGSRATSACIVEGPVHAAYVDARGQPIVATTEESAQRNAGWAVLGPRSAPTGGDDRLNGEAMIGLATYGDCGPAPALASVTFTFAPPTGDVRIPMQPASVGGRCDAPGMPLNLGIFFPLALAWWSTQPPERTAAPAPVTFAIDAPSVAFAGETLSYVVRVRNSSTTLFAWSDGCPIYLEWLGGREAPLPVVPDRTGKWELPAKTYLGVAKELHLLNCAAAGAIAPGGELAFEMRLDVPRDAYGTETLYWSVAGPLPNGSAGAPIEFLAPRR